MRYEGVTQDGSPVPGARFQPPSARLGQALVSLLCLLLLSTAAVSEAATYIVRKTQDTNDGVCDGDCSLREAIVAANANPGLDYVVVPAGTFLLTLVGANENGCATGDLDITDAVFMSGQSPAESVVDASFLGDRVVHVQATGLTVTLYGLTVTGGSSASGGGGVYHQAGTLTLSDVVVSGNQTNGHGGGVYAGSAQLTVTDGSVISDNSAGADSSGGGLFGDDLTVTDSTVSGNQGGSGGGIAVGNTGNLTVSASTLAYNHALNLSGGGIEAWFGAQVELSNTTVVGNSAANGGGYFAEYAQLTLHSVTFSGNSGSTLSDALYVYGGNVTFVNTLVSGRCVLESTTPLSYGGNLESPGNTCALTDAGDQVNVANPKLAPLGSYGGLTQTLVPLLGSPAVGNGSNVYCLTVDQRGVLRSDGLCDVGAVERQAADPLFFDGFESGTAGTWSSLVP